MSTQSTTNAPLHNSLSFAQSQISSKRKYSSATQTPGHNPYPISPPSSTTASHFDVSAPCSPQDHVFTPQSAPPMSAQTSYHGFTPSSYSPPSKEITSAEENQHQDEDAVMQENIESIPPRTSSKHRLSDEDTIGPESNKRRRTDHDRMDVEDNSLGAAPVQNGFSPLHKLEHTPIPLSQPHATADLFSLYCLTPIASSVARNDPITGAKINTLKKSYKGKLKDLSGKNRANANPGELRGLLDYPDEEWHIQRAMGKELVKRDAMGNVDMIFDPAEALLAKLGSALKMQAGELPRAEKEKWEDLLGLDEQTTVKPAPPKIIKAGPGAVTAVAPQNNNNLTTTATVAPPRPKRQGTKRNYDDASFEGYRELAEDVGDTDGDDDGRMGKRKRRKSNPPSTAPSPPFTYASSGPAGVSVGSGSFGVR